MFTCVLAGVVWIAGTIIVAAGHPFDVEVITERQRGHEDGHCGGRLRVTTIMDTQGFTGKIQLKIDAGNTLNVKGDLGTVKPSGVAPAKLPVTQRLPAVHRSDCIVLFPQVFERLSLLSKGAMYFFRINVPVKLGIDKIASLLVQTTCDEFVGDFFRQGIRKLFTLPKAFQELIDRSFSVTSSLGDFPAAHSIGETEDEYSLVVHMRTSSKWIPLPKKRCFHYRVLALSGREL